MQGPTEIASFRRAERARLLAWRRALPPADVAAVSGAIVNRLREILPPYLPATIASYWPLEGEIDLTALLPWLRARDCTVVLPVVEQPRAPLVFRRYDAEAPLERSTYGLWEPRTSDVLSPTVLLVPMVAYDASCQRLGHGGGYYDRTLARLPSATTFGCAYDASELPTIYPLPHDQPLSAVVTEARTLLRPAAAAPG